MASLAVAMIAIVAVGISASNWDAFGPSLNLTRLFGNPFPLSRSQLRMNAQTAYSRSEYSTYT